MHKGVSNIRMLDWDDWLKMSPEQQWEYFATMQDDFDVLAALLPGVQITHKYFQPVIITPQDHSRARFLEE